MLPLNPGRARSWRMADVIDFEFLLEQDRERPPAELEARDRTIASRLNEPDAAVSQPSRRTLFRRWLEVRRTEPNATAMPGDTTVAGLRLLTKGLVLAALLLGALTALGLLRYDGSQPVNVAGYLGWLVFVQILLAMTAFVVLLLRRVGWLSAEATLLTGLLRSIWSALSRRLNRHAIDRIPAERRHAVEAWLGATSGHGRLYQRLMVWPLVGSLQWFGVAFNVAAIGTTLALVVFSDRAFGWQSAVDFSPEQIHEITVLLAAPWSWAVPAAAAPTLEQIAGSKIVLKEGIRQLATENLVAWWPFLVAAVACYGLLPRIILLGLSGVLGRRALAAMAFNHVACDRLYERLVPAGLESRGVGTEPERADLPAEPTSWTVGAGGAASESLTPDDAVVLVDDEPGEQIDRETFRNHLFQRLRLRPAKWIQWSASTAALREVIGELSALKWTDNRPRLVLVEEAWQPPIAEKLNRLRALRETFGADAKLVVVLIGRPAGSEVLTPVRPADLAVWENRARSLGDTQLRVEALVRND